MIIFYTTTLAQGPTKKDKNWYLVEVASEKKAVLSLEEAPFKLYVYEGKSCIMSTADADSGIYCADLFPKGSKPKPPGSESKQKLAKANPKPMDSGKASKTPPHLKKHLVVLSSSRAWCPQEAGFWGLGRTCSLGPCL